MAFTKPQAQQSGNVTQFANKAAGFINVSVVMGNGTVKQIGGVPLHLNKALHQKLIERGDLEGLQLQLDMNILNESDDDLVFAGDESVDAQLANEFQQAQ